MLFKRKRKTRVLVLGLDGVPHGLMGKLTGDGTMPFLAEVFRSGALRRMHVSLPEVSSVNWSSFMTGANPGKHGIFGFTDLRRDSYDLTFPSFPELKSDTMWDELGELGRRCLVLNQPGCYPARAIPGVLVSGFVAVDLKRAVSPKTQVAPLEALGYKIDVDTRDCAGNPDVLFRELDACLASREAAVKHFLDAEEWDFAEVVLTGTDRLQHFHFDACEGEGPLAERAAEYYRKCDDLCRAVVRRFYGKDDPEGLFVLSDHGFARLDRELFLNAWLRERGLLRFDKEPPESYADISADAQAFALDPGRIYVHRKGRYPKGGVDDADAPAVVERIRAEARAFADADGPVFDHVWTRDEIYDGPEAVRGPDLVVTPRRGVDVKGAIRKTEVFAGSPFTGMHTWDDAFLWSAAPAPDDLAISDVRRMVTGHFTR